jgi:hypothetical protein
MAVCRCSLLVPREIKNVRGSDLDAASTKARREDQRLEQDLIAALVISAVGITLLFLALALFYGLLVLLAAVFKGQASADVGGPEPERADAMLQAAAIGVALARAEAEQPPSLDLAPSGEATAGAHSVSPWWALHHQRRVTQKPGSRRVP